MFPYPDCLLMNCGVVDQKVNQCEVPEGDHHSALATALAPDQVT